MKESLETKENNKIGDSKQNEESKSINKSKEIKTIDAPPSIGDKTVIFDDSEFFYSITELENKDGISIKLSEVKTRQKYLFFI